MVVVDGHTFVKPVLPFPTSGPVRHSFGRVSFSLGRLQQLQLHFLRGTCAPENGSRLPPRLSYVVRFFQRRATNDRSIPQSATHLLVSTLAFAQAQPLRLLSAVQLLGVPRARSAKVCSRFARLDTRAFLSCFRP